MSLSYKKIFTKWPTIGLLAFLVPKKKNLLICVELEKGAWRENVKYFYLYLLKKNQNVFFLTEDPKLFRWLQEHKLPSLLLGSFRSYYLLLRTKVLILTSSGWQRRKNTYYLTLRAKKVQLWHGVGIKRFELLEKKNAEYINSLRGKIDNAFRRKFIKHDITISTSTTATEMVFKKAIRSKFYLESGYPRNDFLLNEEMVPPTTLYHTPTSYDIIKKKRDDGWKIILYAPTQRKGKINAIKAGILDLAALSEYAVRKNIMFVFKLHPQDLSTLPKIQYKGIDFFEASADVQPLLRISNMLVTDYSSIYIDYLLLDKPIIFLPYDIEEYLLEDRGLLFDYADITPGPKCQTQEALLDSITLFMEKPNYYQKQRNKLSSWFHQHKDCQASDRIWSYISKRYMKKQNNNRRKKIQCSI